MSTEKYSSLLYGKVNPSVLISSFLVRIPPYGPFPWKRSSAVYFFCFQKPANSKQAWPECHTINYLLTWLARAVLGNIGPRSFFALGPYCHDRGPIFPSTALALG